MFAPASVTRLFFGAVLLRGFLQQARDFLIFLLSEIGQDFIENKTDMLALQSEKLRKNRHFRPIRLDTGLLVYLDRLKKERFLEEWKQALIQ